jgi:hypothetical protein
MIPAAFQLCESASSAILAWVTIFTDKIVDAMLRYEQNLCFSALRPIAICRDRRVTGQKP